MIHSHRFTTEIIGLYAGTWDVESKTLEITRAFPCRALESLQDVDETKTFLETNVEMDPISMIERRDLITNLSLSLVGWYHSHPKFQPLPSYIDVENQRAYQGIFLFMRGIFSDCTNGAPFLGGIYSPFPASSEVFSLFSVVEEWPVGIEYQVEDFADLSLVLKEVAGFAAGDCFGGNEWERLEASIRELVEGDLDDFLGELKGIL